MGYIINKGKEISIGIFCFFTTLFTILWISDGFVVAIRFFKLSFILKICNFIGQIGLYDAIWSLLITTIIIYITGTTFNLHISNKKGKKIYRIIGYIVSFISFLLLFSSF